MTAKPNTAPIYSISGVKTFPAREGIALDCKILKDGKAIGHFHDAGDGGIPRIDMKPGEQPAFEAFARDWYTTSGEEARSNEMLKEYRQPDAVVEPHRFDTVVDGWISHTYDAMANKKRLDRAAKTSTLFQLAGDPKTEYRVLKAPYDARVQAHLDKTYAGQVVSIYGVELTPSMPCAYVATPVAATAAKPRP